MRKVFICCVFLWMFDAIASSFLFGDIQNFHAVCSMKQWDQKGQLLLQQTGQCDFHAPNWFAFISDDPHKPSLYLQPKQMVVIDPQLEQVMISPIGEQQKTVLHLFQQSKTAWLHQFHLHKNGHVWMLSARRPAQHIQTVQANYHSVTPPGSWPSQMTIQDRIGVKTQLQFSHVNIHDAVPLTRFHPIIPANDTILGSAQA